MVVYGNGDERKIGWKSVEEALDSWDLFLKIRWHLHRKRLCFWARLRRSTTSREWRYAAHSDYGGHVSLSSILPLTHTSVYQCSAPTCEEVNWESYNLYLLQYSERISFCQAISWKELVCVIFLEIISCSKQISCCISGYKKKQVMLLGVLSSFGSITCALGL